MGGIKHFRLLFFPFTFQGETVLRVSPCPGDLLEDEIQWLLTSCWSTGAHLRLNFHLPTINVGSPVLPLALTGDISPNTETNESRISNAFLHQFFLDMFSNFFRVGVQVFRWFSSHVALIPVDFQGYTEPSSFKLQILVNLIFFLFFFCSSRYGTGNNIPQLWPSRMRGRIQSGRERMWNKLI